MLSLFDRGDGGEFHFSLRIIKALVAHPTFAKQFDRLDAKSARIWRAVSGIPKAARAGHGAIGHHSAPSEGGSGAVGGSRQCVTNLAGIETSRPPGRLALH